MGHKRTHFFIRLALLIFLVVGVLFQPLRPAQAAGARYYVRGNGGSDGNSGTSWAQAYKNLQKALAVAANGDEIWVAAGVYYPDNGGPYPLDSRAATFTLPDGVRVYGGFAGTETSLSECTIAANPTILSGDVDNNDVNTDGNFIAETTGDLVGANAYHVVTTSGTNIATLLDGFIITAGQANAGAAPDQDGGGLYNDGGSPTLSNLTLQGNWAEVGGGMLNLNAAAPSMERVVFRQNQAGTGGGMYNHISNPALKNVDFDGNIATSSSTGGGGMFNYKSSPNLQRVNFTGNKANSGAGGGMYNYDTSSPVITDASFTGNSALNGGGLRNHINNQPVLTNVTFNGNEAQYGGGVSNDNSIPFFYNATFAGNFANQGGAMNNYQSSPRLWNATFYGNIAQAADQGGGLYNSTTSAPFLRNVILAGSTNGDCVNDAGSSITGWYSLIQDTGARACGATNGSQGLIVGADPQLGPLRNNGGFTLTFTPLVGSPVVDAVIDNNCTAGNDQRGFSRFIDGDRNGSAVCDIGAVEAGFSTFLPAILR